MLVAAGANMPSVEGLAVGESNVEGRGGQRRCVAAIGEGDDYDRSTVMRIDVMRETPGGNSVGTWGNK